MNALKKSEISSSQIAEIFEQYENQIMQKFRQKYQFYEINENTSNNYRNKSAKITLKNIPLTAKNKFGIKLYQKLTKLQINDISFNIKKDLTNNKK